MISLILAAICFLGIHVFVSGTGLRDRIVRRTGERAYLGLFSLASLAAIIWMSTAYGTAPYIELWPFGTGAKHIAFVLLAPAVAFVVLGLTTPNPTATGGAGALERERGGVGILAVTRHPLMWGIAIWALAHLAANGDVASLILFGSFGGLALFGPRLIDAKMARRHGDAWRRFQAETSWLPFRAMAQGRASFRRGELGWWRLLLAIVVYLVLLFLVHDWLIGLPLVAI